MKRLKIIIPLLLMGIFFFNTGSAQSGYIKIGDIKGESVESNHKDWVIIQSFSQSLSMPASAGAVGAGRRRGTVVLEDIKISKLLDKSSPKLMEAAVKGQVIPEVILDIMTAGRNPLYKITLSNVLVSSFSNSGSCSSQCEIMEEVSFNFEKITWEYTDAKGGKVISSYSPGKGI
jgi:type VI secretion system secreted protein Hcp